MKLDKEDPKKNLLLIAVGRQLLELDIGISTYINEEVNSEERCKWERFQKTIRDFLYEGETRLEERKINNVSKSE